MNQDWTGGSRLTPTPGQTFTVGVAGRLVAIEFMVVGAPAVPGTIRVLEGGLTVASEPHTLFAGMERVTFSAPLRVAVGDSLLFQFIPDGPAGPIRVAQTADTYSGGAATHRADRDLVFMTFVAPCAR